jgi:hypothetical protein
VRGGALVTTGRNDAISLAVTAASPSVLKSIKNSKWPSVLVGRDSIDVMSTSYLDGNKKMVDRITNEK